MWIKWKLIVKYIETLILAYCWPEKIQKYGPLDPYFTHNLPTPENTSDMPVNQVSRSHSKMFWEKWQKAQKNDFYDILLEWLKAKDKDSNCTGVWATLLRTFKPNIGKVWLKTEGAYLIWKKMTGGWTTATDGSAPDRLLYVSSGADNIIWMGMCKSSNKTLYLSPALWCLPKQHPSLFNRKCKFPNW